MLRDRQIFRLLKEDLEWCDVVAAGPGLGQGPQECSLLQFLLENCAKPLVLDADALNLFGKNPHWAKKLPKTCVFTPHLMEMSRMTGIKRWKRFKENRFTQPMNLRKGIR